jgi:hypothetical protein
MLYFVVIGMIMILLPHITTVSSESLVASALVVLYLSPAGRLVGNVSRV